MEELTNQWIGGAVLGFIIGALIVWLFGRGSKNRANEDLADLRNEYDGLKKEYHKYREDVNAHFAKTADAVDNLTKSYQDVFTHLSDGAQNLMDKKALQAQLEKRQGKAVTLAYLVNEQDSNVEKPTQVTEKSVLEHSKSGTSDNAINLTKGSSKPSKTDKPTVKPAKQPTTVIPPVDKKTTAQATPFKTGSASIKSKEETKPNVNSKINNSNKNKNLKTKNSQEKFKQPENTSAKNSTVNKENKEGKHTQVKPEKTPAQEAAEKAGLKSASTLTKEEAAIDSVKKHLNKKKSS